LSASELVLARIKELQTAVAERVVAAEARRRSWRVELLQSRIDKAIALSQARATMYASEMGESYQFQVADRAAELSAIADGCRPAPIYIPAPPADWKDPKPPAPPEFPKTMIHPGFPIGGSTGLLMKDYRGKNAEHRARRRRPEGLRAGLSLIWKFDAALEARIADNRLSGPMIMRGNGLQILLPAEALKAFERAANLDASLFQAQFNHGLALLKLSRAADALAPLRLAFELLPQSQEAATTFGLAAVMNQRYAEAVPPLELAWKRDPANTRLGALVATAYLRTGDPAKAITGDVPGRSTHTGSERSRN
jgi:tetratricopeptide (TPR) repeat protein